MKLQSASPPFATWSSCRCCDLLQPLPAPVEGHQRVCSRCETPFGSGIIMAQPALAFAATALLLFALAQFFPLLGMQIAGMTQREHIFSGASGMADNDFPSLGFLVLAFTIIAPLGRIVTLIWVIGSLYLKRRSSYLLKLYKLSEKLRPWAMLDVLLLGTFIASNKLRDYAQVEIGMGFWTLGLAVAALVALDTAFDRRAIWDILMPPPVFLKTKPDLENWAACEGCGLLQEANLQHAKTSVRCKRCNIRMHHRKPDSINTTWAYVIAGFILYIPANAYPVMTTISFGQETVSTIMGGVRQLLASNDWLFAMILFTASIIIPLLKLFAFIWMMISTRLKSTDMLVTRTKLYRMTSFIGRWSNIDIFVAALLTGLVTLGNIATVIPGHGALAFAAVVILTMMAAESFDPRLMWDAAGKNHGA